MSRNLRTKSNLLFAQIVALGTIIFLLLAGFIFKIYNYIFSATGEYMLSLANKACGCSAFTSGNHTVLTGLLFFFGASLVLAIFIAIGRVIFSIKKTNTFIRNQKINLAIKSAKLAQTADRLGITNQVEEIKSISPAIFCYGITKPKIFISSNVVSALNSSELKAVLLHETQHIISREPARLLVIQFINTFRFIPGIKKLTKKYLSFSELAADELATNNFTEKINIARAMRKILALQEKTIIQKGIALSYFSHVTEERVRALSENDYNPAFGNEIIKVSFGVMVAIIFFFYFSSEIKAQTNYTKQLYANSPCASQEFIIEACENKWTNCAGKIYHEKNIACKNTLKYLKAL